MLKIYMGCVKSSKTSRLISDLSQYADLGLNVLYLNHEKDKARINMSHDEFLSTHNGAHPRLHKDIIAKRISSLEEVDTMVDEFHVIGIDECNFFHPLVSVVRRWLFDKRKIIIAVGLDGSFAAEPFGEFLQLIPLSASCEKLLAICDKCRKPDDPTSLVPAPYSIKLQNIDKNQIEEVGGGELYLSVCLQHYVEFYKVHIDKKEES